MRSAAAAASTSDGPAGGSAEVAEESVSEIAAVYNAYIPRDLVKPSLVIKEVS